ncbi:MAG: DNA polymerase I [Verrucomicrobia bacterium]|nr:DNA polymerase I [Verrucomicrobiota bacterium]
MVAREWRSGQTVRVWLEAAVMPPPPFLFGPKDLLVAYLASAELGCFLELDWELPQHVLDLYVEFRRLLAGQSPAAGFGLLGALMHFGLSHGVDQTEKTAMRELAQASVFSNAQKAALLAYCEADVVALEKLLAAMQARLDLPRALLRGRYMAAVARIERTGIPLDTTALGLIQRHWPELKHQLIAEIDAGFGVFDANGAFVAARWLRWCAAHQIPWPLLNSGRPQLDDDTFAEMAKSFPVILPIKELRATLGQARETKFSVGLDGRNRFLLSPFGSRTSRNQPSNTRSIFGPATWYRYLIQPTPGRALAYLDYEQQEFGIGAALSGDDRMKDAYASGDPYLSFGKQAGAVPPDATKMSHPTERDRYKTCALGVQYGIGQDALARRLNLSPAHGRELIAMHRKVYQKYWTWSDRIEARAMLGSPLVTAFGWRIRAGAGANPRSLRNFPLQANGAEMLRIAAIALTEAGIAVCAPVHDAVLIEAATDQIDAVAKAAQALLERASQAVLGDFTLRTEAKIIRWPERFSEPRGAAMWERVTQLLPQFTAPLNRDLG